MNILKNRTVLGLSCIILSLIICFGLTPLFNNAIKSQEEIVRIVKDVKKGENITDDKLTVIKVGGHNLPNNVLKTKEDVVGKYAKTDLTTGDYIFDTKLSDKPLAEFEYLTELDGTKQAISVTIKSFAHGLSGKLESGDIISIIASDYGDFRETLVPSELKYVKVLAVTDGKGYDKEYIEDSSDEKQLPSTVTLLATSQQAKILAELESKGKIHCSLIYRGDEKTVKKFLKIQDDYLKTTVQEDTEITKREVISKKDTTNSTYGQEEILDEIYDE